MKIYLVRHGQTDWNIQGRYQGIENIPLNETGMEQARVCATALADYSFVAFYASPLQRAYDTASLIAETLNAHQLRNGVQATLSVVKDARLLERDFGKISGLLPEERKAFLESGEEANMEPFEHLTDRVMEAMEEYRRCYSDGNVLVVTHGGVINSILHVLSRGEVGTGKTLVANTSVAILNDESGELLIECYNQKL
ncbi:histidine phosphatase family protein [Anaerosporobacter faecicola]|uniref:histidine phosphatase family protein n=1 Tax=Anaerosporobacter faecicola TaxID=2718714 RepID=UPI0014398D22|nr:histidine phosphatase family protein [Anaerosporobacter faecicola]